MKKIAVTQSIMAVALGALLAAGNALAQESLGQKAQQLATTAGTKIDSSIDKASGYIGDSAVTGKVKGALLEDKTISSNDISVSTDNGVVTLSGFVASQAIATRAVGVAAATEGVTSVSDKLQIKDSASQSAGAYADDTLTTSTIKAKLLADDIVPSRNVKVTTHDGVVQLSGEVKTQAQAARAESIAKAVDGVKSVKNDLAIKP